MKFKARKTLRVGPVVVHFTQRGFSSWGLQVGRWTWNARTGRLTLDTPGPGSVTWGGRSRQRARGECEHRSTRATRSMERRDERERE